MVEQLQTIPLDQIVVGDRRRTRQEAKIPELAESISKLGLINPIVVVTNGDSFRLVAGLHRLEAHRLLGLTEIEASVRDQDVIDAELTEIDENLVRSELTVLEQAEHLARREELLRVRGERAPSHRPDKGASAAPLQTTATLANRIGLSERTAQERLQIARRLPDDVRDLVRSTPVANNRGSLLDLARIEDPNSQKQIAEYLVKDPTMPVFEAEEAVDRAQRRAPGNCRRCGTAADELVDKMCRTCIHAERQEKRKAARRATRDKVKALRSKHQKFDDQAAEWLSWDLTPLVDLLDAHETRRTRIRVGQLQQWLGNLEQQLQTRRQAVGDGGVGQDGTC